MKYITFLVLSIFIITCSLKRDKENTSKVRFVFPKTHHSFASNKINKSFGVQDSEIVDKDSFNCFVVFVDYPNRNTGNFCKEFGNDTNVLAEPDKVIGMAPVGGELTVNLFQGDNVTFKLVAFKSNLPFPECPNVLDMNDTIEMDLSHPFILGTDVYNIEPGINIFTLTGNYSTRKKVGECDGPFFNFEKGLDCGDAPAFNNIDFNYLKCQESNVSTWDMHNIGIFDVIVFKTQEGRLVKMRILNNPTGMVNFDYTIYDFSGGYQSFSSRSVSNGTCMDFESDNTAASCIGNIVDFQYNLGTPPYIKVDSGASPANGMNLIKEDGKCASELTGVWESKEGGCKNITQNFVYSAVSGTTMIWGDAIWDSNYSTSESSNEFDFGRDDDYDPLLQSVTDDATKSYCHDLIEGGYKDWRMPTLLEMTIATGAYLQDSATYVWSSSSSGGSVTRVLSSSGANDIQPASNFYNARCVRKPGQ